MKKVVLEVDDFNKIVSYIISTPVAFQHASKAAEVERIIKGAKIAEITEDIKNENKSNKR